MKTSHCLVLLALAGSAFAGETIVRTRQSYKSSAECTGSGEASHGRLHEGGTPGTFYYSNCARNAVKFINDTPDFVTFFVYSADEPGSADIHDLIRQSAHVYPTIVPPYGRSFTDQRGRFYWVCTKPGKWGIDLAERRIAPAY